MHPQNGLLPFLSKTVITTSSCARFATCATSSLRSLCHCGASASLAPTQHIYKLVSEHYPDCNGNSSAHVQGRRQLNLLLSGLCNTTLIYLPCYIHDCSNPHAHARYW